LKSREWQADALQGQIAELRAEKAEHDMLRLGNVAFAETCSLANDRRPAFEARFSIVELAQHNNRNPR
jgi:hypothetical protein